MPFDDIDTYKNLGEQFVLPKADKVSKMFTDDCRNWLCDDKCREQLLLRYGQETEVHSWHPFEGLVGFYCGEKQKEQGKVWCDWEVKWSPHGNYVTTFHKPGILIWGGDDMTNKRRFMHQQVQHIQFSPNEEFLVTWNGADYESRDPNAYKIWNIKTGKTVVTRATPQYSPCGLYSEFPHFVFSPDAKFMARSSESSVFIHDSKKNLSPLKDSNGDNVKFHFENGVGHFKFSPTGLPKPKKEDKKAQEEDDEDDFAVGNQKKLDSIMAVWSPQRGDLPGKASLINVNTQRVLQTKSCSNFSAVMEWQNKGEFLALILSPLSKAERVAGKQRGAKGGEEDEEEDENMPAGDVRLKTQAQTIIGNERPALRNAKQLEIFRVKERNIPVEHVEVPDVIKGFFWEPRSNRFALLTEGASAQKTNMIFFSLKAQKCEEVCRFELPGGSFNKLFFAPEGQYFVVAAVEQGAGELIWGRLDENHKLDLLFKDEQYNLTNVEWDASSRFVLTSVQQPITDANASLAQDTGYAIWTFQGRMVHREKLEKLYNASWRPHPPTYIAEEKEIEVRKNLKAHSKRFDKADDIAKDKARNEIRELRDSKIREFNETMGALEARFLDHARQPNVGWADAWERFDEEHRWKDVTEMVDEIIDVKEEQIDF